MEHKAKSIRPFIGAKDFATSRSFYRDLGFEEVVLSPQMSLFKTGQFGFYLQNGYVKNWVANVLFTTHPASYGISASFLRNNYVDQPVISRSLLSLRLSQGS